MREASLLICKRGRVDPKVGTEKSRRVLGRAKKILATFRAGQLFSKYFFPLFFEHRVYQLVAMHLEYNSNLNALHIGVISSPSAIVHC